MKKIITIMLALACVLAFAACGGANSDNEQEKIYYFKSGDVKIDMNVDATAILEKLGEPSSRFEEESCAGLGTEITYIYPGFELKTYRTSDSAPEKTYTVYFTDDTVATAEGVRLGDAVSKVIDAYGVGKADDTKITVTAKNCDISFIMKDGAVSSVEYLANDAVTLE